MQFFESIMLTCTKIWDNYSIIQAIFWKISPKTLEMLNEMLYFFMSKHIEYKFSNNNYQGIIHNVIDTNQSIIFTIFIFTILHEPWWDFVRNLTFDLSPKNSIVTFLIYMCTCTVYKKKLQRKRKSFLESFIIQQKLVF